MPSPLSRLELVRRRGRRVGIAVFAVLVSSMTAHWTYQVLRQVWVKDPEIVTVQCRYGVRGLSQAVRRARSAAAAATGDERAALAEFRSALLPEWVSRPALAKACLGDRDALKALEELDALRYAEEHAVRYEAMGLAPQRRRVHALE